MNGRSSSSPFRYPATIRAMLVRWPARTTRSRRVRRTAPSPGSLRISSSRSSASVRWPVPKLLVEDAWKAYQPISKRDNDTWKSEEGRAKHLTRHLGNKLAAGLTVKDVD